MRPRARRASPSSRTTSSLSCSSIVRKRAGWSATSTSGKVEAVLPGLQAAFVDIGTEKSAFLHASDLVYPEDETTTMTTTTTRTRASESRVGGEPRAANDGSDAKVPPDPGCPEARPGAASSRSRKEPISTKGPRVTAQVSMAGRFLVYMPFASRVGREPQDRRPRRAQAPARAGGRHAARGLGRRHRPHRRRGRHPGDVRARARPR